MRKGLRSDSSDRTLKDDISLLIREYNGRLDVFLPNENATVRISPSRDQLAATDVSTQQQHSSLTTLSGNLLSSSSGSSVEEPVLAVQGLFGVYSIPSGELWVWVADSNVVYEAPKINGKPCWKIRKIERLHISWVSKTTTTSSLTHAQRQEELRQVALLRYALKHHDWYMGPLPGQKTTILPFLQDMTRNLQSALELSWSHTKVNNQTAFLSSDSTSTDDDETYSPDSRFYWNEALVQPLQDIAPTNQAAKLLLHHTIPATSAFVGVQRNLTLADASSTDKKLTKSTSLQYDQLLVTRRSKFRVGTRFTKRGADHTGAVANYAETEQIVVVYHGHNQTLESVSSHVQTRGSIPLRWSSPTDIKTYRPRVRIGTDPLAQARALRLHVTDQVSRFVLMPSDPKRKKHPSLIFVNLVDKKSDQGRLGRAFDVVLDAVLDIYNGSAVTADPSFCESDPPRAPTLDKESIQHIWYDFHAEVKHGRWDSLEKLLSKVKGALKEQNYLRATPSSGGVGRGSALVPDHLQTGVVRTNCMDCLDRTNVVQSIFGRYMLFEQLSENNNIDMPPEYKTAFRKNPLSIPWTQGEVSHRLLWADNADAISRLYAGTPALKGDFTRTGKRTKKGALDDGMNSLQRYYLNNFLDADRQEGMDLLVGFQPFGFAEGLLHDDRSLEGARTKPNFDGISIQEAARRALLGVYDTVEDFGDDNHARIKVRGRHHDKVTGPVPVGGAIGRPQLDLRWLAGDLQTHVRSIVSSELCDFPGSLSSQEALQALDSRSSSYMPWWVVPDTSDGEETESAAARSQELADAEVNGLNNAGYLLGSVIIGTQSPLTMAGVVLALVGASMNASVDADRDGKASTS